MTAQPVSLLFYSIKESDSVDTRTQQTDESRFNPKTVLTPDCCTDAVALGKFTSVNRYKSVNLYIHSAGKLILPP